MFKNKDDKYIISGTKIWTTHAHFANKIFCLVRTDNSTKPQQGITFLLIDMEQDGVNVEPIIMLSGDHDVNQVVFNDAEASIDQRIGNEGEGWTVAKYLLEFERGGSSASARSFKPINLAKSLAEEIIDDDEPLLANPAYIKRISELELRAQSLQYTELRTLSSMKKGGSPGPESSMSKNLATDLQQEITEITLDIIGYFGIPKHDNTLGNNEAPVGSEKFITQAGRYQNSRAASIYGGSREIQKNIIAKAVLGL